MGNSKSFNIIYYSYFHKTFCYISSLQIYMYSYVYIHKYTAYGTTYYTIHQLFKILYLFIIMDAFKIAKWD